MRLRTWLFLGYSAVLALATLGLGLGLVTVLGLAATSGRMVDENFRALDVASRLRRLMSAEQMLVVRGLGAGEADAVQDMAPFEREARRLLAEARVLGGADTEVDDLAAIARAERAVDTLLAAVGAAATATPATPISPPRARLTPEVVEAFGELRRATLDYYALHHHAMVERGNRIRRQSDRLAVALALLGGFTVLIGVLASLRLADRLSRPMERLSRAAAQVAGGNFEVRIGRSGLREADLVAQRFDDMTASLGRFHAMNLDRIVADSRRLDQVVASIDEGLVIFDERGRIERCNPAACDWLGFDPGAAPGQRLEVLATLPEIAAAVQRAVAEPGRRGARAEGELRLGEGEGSEARTLAWTLLPFSAQARYGLILALRDVTAARQFERMRTDFVLRASHELRTPITGMRMAFGLLDDKLDFAPDSREGELVATLRDETQRLVNLINALLDLSRLYAGSYPLQRAPTDLAELMQRARQRFAPVAEHAGISLELALPAPLPPVDIDAGAIDRVLDNLAGNAIRHTPRDGQIELGAAPAEGGVEFWVRDTGDGIAHADRARVFEPFVQVGHRVGGVGLGLAMCREILRQHGGHIRLDSAPGRGSCFTAWLPA
jgi:NtrC-family two-component system sensor histidine kinase KinB